jgi:hypothetical protein
MPKKSTQRQPQKFEPKISERTRALPAAAMQSKSSSQQCQRSKG